MCLKDHVTLRVGDPHDKLSTWNTFGGNRQCLWRYNGFSWSHNLARPCDQRVKVSHHPARFGGHSYCGIRYVMVLVCHKISQDHVIRGSRDFTGKSLSW